MATSQAIGLGFTCLAIQQLCDQVRADRRATVVKEPYRNALVSAREMVVGAKGWFQLIRDESDIPPRQNRQFPTPGESLRFFFFIFRELDLIDRTTTPDQMDDWLTHLESTLTVLEEYEDAQLLSDEDIEFLDKIFAFLGQYSVDVGASHVFC